MPEERVNVAMRTLTSAIPRVLCVYVGGKKAMIEYLTGFFFLL